ncbi:protein still life, isoforms C/SIF type 2-like, partial [Saccostrea cucullata]|uniref:protein still life, isoforms C/SIF type 2-like n=1 Tax=Saccostrea cuccullata TaxID=36930 RepID=UPI002ED3C53D
KIQLNVGDLCTYGVVSWCNIGDIIGRKSQACHVITSVFVFRSGLVIICRKKKTEEGKVDCPCSSEIFRTVIPVQDMVLDVVTGKSGALYQWNITQSPIDNLPHRTYKFCSSSAEEKSRFVTAIRGTTRPPVKHLNTPISENHTKHFSPKLECITRKLRTIRNKNPRGGSEVHSD